jgi:putative GTP pyrophosphokinase
MEHDEIIQLAVDEYRSKQYIFERFLNGVVDFFALEPSLNKYESPIIHTIKSRLKDHSHLKDKIERKWGKDGPITKDNIFGKITDLAGVRILHLYQDQFPRIHEHIMRNVAAKEWFLFEKPVVYSWDPEAIEFFKNLGLHTEIKPSYYTSIHYVVSPREDSEIYCEIQVRTLFEEIWGEIDHSLNYPEATKSQACREQLRVLSKLVSTGTRLADSIYRTKEAEVKSTAF